MPKGSTSSGLAELDPEIARTYHRSLRSARRLQFVEIEEEREENLSDESEAEVNTVEVMADQRRTMSDYARPTLDSTGSCIVQPAIDANNFEVKASTMNMIYNRCQFDGMPHEDPHAHIKMFLDICNTVKQNGVSDDAFKLRLFPFTLNGKARD